MGDKIGRLIEGLTPEEAIEKLEHAVFMREMNDHMATNDYEFCDEANKKIRELKEVLKNG